MNEYLLKSDVEKVLSEWAKKAWADEWKPTHENVRGDTFEEARLIVMDMPSVKLDELKEIIQSRITSLEQAEEILNPDYHKGSLSAFMQVRDLINDFFDDTKSYTIALKEMVLKIYNCIEFEAYKFNPEKKVRRPRLEFEKAYKLLEDTANNKKLINIRLVLLAALGDVKALRYVNDRPDSDSRCGFCRTCKAIYEDDLCDLYQKKTGGCYTWRFSEEIKKLSTGNFDITLPNHFRLSLPLPEMTKTIQAEEGL